MYIPKNDTVAITPISEPETTPGGIIIPEQAQGRIKQGIVKYVGPKVPEDIRPGMWVIFSGYAGQLVSIEGEGVLIITRYTSIVASVPEVQNVPIPGLYFKALEGDYIPATYEAAVNMIALAMSDSALARLIGKRYFVPKEMDWVNDNSS